MVVYAHSRNSRGIRHGLPQHLTDVAAKARSYADKFGAGELAYWAGIWHDVGKFHPAFQQYLLDCEAAPKTKRRGPDHKRAGATLAAKRLAPLALLIQGHHGGLLAREQLTSWLTESSFQTAISSAVALARAELGTNLEPQVSPASPHRAASDSLESELLLRMLFLDAVRPHQSLRTYLRGTE